jgi:hypothetical protein
MPTSKYFEMYHIPYCQMSHGHHQWPFCHCQQPHCQSQKPKSPKNIVIDNFMLLFTKAYHRFN